MNIYYYFSVNDRFFAEGTREFLKIEPTAKFSGLAAGRKDFLETPIFEAVSYLSEIKYKDTSKLDYVYLAHIEEKYNFKLAEIINSERHFWRLEKSQRLMYAQEIIKQIESDFEHQKFDTIFVEGLDDFPSYFLFYFAKRKNLPYYYFIYARLGGAVFLSDREDTGPKDLEIYFDKNVSEYHLNPQSFEATIQFINTYKNNKSQPYYVTQSSMLYKRFTIEDIRVALNVFKNYKKDSNSYIAYDSPFMLPLKRITKIRNKMAYKTFFADKFVNQTNLHEQKYFVYPLHFHPEAATLVQGRWLNNQKIIIEMFSKYLPADVIMIVKEHKVSIGRRPIAFYKEIEELHNVHFISENADVYRLIEESMGIVTISSSMGLEAVMLNKPVITFGDIHYNILSQVIKAREISKMEDYINQALDFKGYNKDEYWAFFKAITENCYEMPGYSPHNFTNAHVNTFVQMLTTINSAKKVLND